MPKEELNLLQFTAAIATQFLRKSCGAMLTILLLIARLTIE